MGEEGEKPMGTIVKSAVENQLDKEKKHEAFVDIEILMSYLNVPKKTIYRWIDRISETGIPSYRIGKRLKFKLSEIDGWIAKYKRCS